MGRTQLLHPWLKPLCFFVAYQPKWKPTWEATHVVQPISKSQDPIWYIRNGKKLRTFAKLWRQWYVWQTGLVVTHLMKSPTESTQCDTILYNVKLFYPMWHYSTQCETILYNVTLFYTMCHCSTHCNVSLLYSIDYTMWHCSSTQYVTLFYTICDTPANVHTALCLLHYSDGGYGAADFDHHTCPFCKIHPFIWNPWPRQSGMPQKHQGPGCRFLSIPCLPSSEGSGAGTRVSELVTLTKRLSKSGHSCLFIQLFNFGI